MTANCDQDQGSHSILPDQIQEWWLECGMKEELYSNPVP